VPEGDGVAQIGGESGGEGDGDEEAALVADGEPPGDAVTAAEVAGFWATPLHPVTRTAAITIDTARISATRTVHGRLALHLMPRRPAAKARV